MRIRTLGLFLLAAMLLAACGSGSEDTTTTADAGQEDQATTTTEAEMTTTEAEMTTTTAEDMTTTSAAEAMDGVHAAETDLGSILVDPEGMTLYIFTPDTEGVSTCYDSCAENWPAVPADTPIGSDLDEAMFGAAPRDDGGDQLTVNDMPLYYFAGDSSPGDTNGQGLNDVWFVVDAGGSAIEASAAQQNTSAPADDYGYGS